MILNLKIFLCALTVFSTYDDVGFEDLYPLEGTWQMKTSKGVLFETWTKAGPIELRGRSYRVNGSDTVHLETVTLIQDDSGIHYIPVVQNQNEGQPVRFTLISAEEKRFVFENMDHDYPQRIIYRFISSDFLVARVEGEIKGQLRGSDYPFSRVH